MERRREKRFKQWNSTRIKAASGPKSYLDTEGINAYTHDISLGGANIHSEEPFPAGTEIRMHIDLSRARQTISVDGTVKWVRRNEDEGVYELGVEFKHLLPKTVFALIRNLYDESSGLPTHLG